MQGRGAQSGSERRLKRLVVVGAGAIGGGIGGMLAEAGFHVELVARGAHAEAIQARGLEIRLPHTSFRVQVPCRHSVREVDWRADDAVLVATKLYDARQALDEIREAAGPGIRVIGAQNGMVADEWARERFDTVVPTMVFVPAEYLEPGRIDLHGIPVPGAVDVGPGGADFAAALRASGFRSTVRSDLLRWKRAKWVTNLCGAALVYGHQDWVPGLMAEGRAVLAAAGLDVATAAEMESYVGDIRLAPIAGNERLPGGSTAQSRARGRPLEVEWLNGPLVALARELGIPVPLNEAVSRLSADPRGRNPGISRPAR